jgi:hypothetical protein
VNANNAYAHAKLTLADMIPNEIIRIEQARGVSIPQTAFSIKKHSARQDQDPVNVKFNKLAEQIL